MLREGKTTNTLYAGGDPAFMQRADKEHIQLSEGTFTMPRLLRTAPNGDIFVPEFRRRHDSNSSRCRR
jgi:hypothetical protein